MLIDMTDFLSEKSRESFLDPHLLPTSFSELQLKTSHRDRI